MDMPGMYMPQGASHLVVANGEELGESCSACEGGVLLNHLQHTDIAIQTVAQIVI